MSGSGHERESLPGRNTRAVLKGAVLALILTGCGSHERQTPLADSPPVIIISIDTLRADHLPAYGYAGVATPAIDTFRADAVLFRNAYAQCPLTLPSHASMLTGLYPAQAGVRDNLGYTFDSAAHPTIPGILEGRGYDTGAAVSAYVLRSASGLGAAFDDYDDSIEVQPGEALGTLQRSAGATIEIAQRWVDQHKTGPFFYFLHLFEPHGPYDPPEPFRARYSSNLYDGEIAAVDEAFGKFMQFLKQSGVYDRAVIIFMSDHGEGLGDHGEDEHGIFLYKEAIHVPLIVKLPAQRDRGTTHMEVAQLVDLLPSICSIVGAPVPAGLPGRSLLDKNSKGNISAYSETVYPRIHLGWSDLHSLIDSRFHFIESPSPELFDHIDDPGEKSNRLSDERRSFAEMRREVAARRTSFSPPAVVDPEEARKLAALGYLGSSAPSESASLADPKAHIDELRKMKTAMAAAQSGEYASAIRIYKDLLSKNPQFPDAWGQLAAAYRSAGMLEESADAYKRALQITPSLRQEIALSLASVLLDMGKYDEAYSHAQLALGSQASAARLLLGRVHLARREFSAAEQQARSVMSDAGYSLAAKILLGQALVGQRRYPEALETLTSAQQQARVSSSLFPPLLNFALGDALARSGRPLEAEAAFREEIRLYPRNRETYANLAVLLLLSGRNTASEEALNTMVRANPGPSSYEFAARTLEQVGARDAAARWRRRATRGGV